MKKVLSWLWQLPQNLLGLLVIAVFRCVKIKYLVTPEYWRSRKDYPMLGAVSLGEYRIMFFSPEKKCALHEFGHTRQSRRLGWLYLLLIGLPSVIGNIAHRFARFDYYAQPWEKWADELGGVER